MSESDLLEQIARLERLVMALAEKLATVAEHLARLAERKDRRHVAVQG